MSVSAKLQKTSVPLVERLRAMDRLLTAPQLAAMLGLHRLTLYTKAREGKIPSLRVGDAIRFDPVEIANYLQGNRTA
jgi:excisionase family DNA binding protein